MMIYFQMIDTSEDRSKFEQLYLKERVLSAADFLCFPRAAARKGTEGKYSI